MRKILVVLLTLSMSFLLSNCSKSDFNDPYGNSYSSNGSIIPQYATIKIVNSESDPYNIKINNSDKGTINPKSTLKFEVEADKSYKVTVKQLSGYLLYPTTHTWDLRAEANYTYTCTIQ